MPSPAAKLVRHSAYYAAPSAASLATRHSITRHVTTQQPTNSKLDISPSSNDATDAGIRQTGDSHLVKEAQHKSQAKLDRELRAKMATISGEGGEAGVEYEDDKPVAMKRSVKNNMFRLI
jgi:hypothetical protein